MSTIKLLSHAIPHSPFNSERITYYGGKPETVVEGDCVGIRERFMSEPVHLRLEADDTRCAKCGRLAIIWHDSEDRWANHPARCN